MTQYIDKSAVVAEIDNRIRTYKNVGGEDRRTDALISFRNFLNTLEVKEVDLELNSFDATVCKIGSTYLKEMDKDAIVKTLQSYKDGDKEKIIIKAQKEE